MLRASFFVESGLRLRCRESRLAHQEREMVRWRYPCPDINWEILRINWGILRFILELLRINWEMLRINWGILGDY